MSAPLGNQNAIKGKRWQQAIDRALERRCKADGIAELDRLAEAFLTAIEVDGATGGITGYKELADRLDGKVPQQLDHGNAGGQPFVVTMTPTDGNL